MMGTLRVGVKSGRKLGIAEAKISVVRIGHVILESIGIGQGIFAVGDDGHIFNAVTVKVRGDERRGELCRNGKCFAELLFHQRRELGGISPRRGGRLACLWRLRSRNARGQKQDLAQELHKQSLPLLGLHALGIKDSYPARQQLPAAVYGPSTHARWSWWSQWLARRTRAPRWAEAGRSTY